MKHKPLTQLVLLLSTLAVAPSILSTPAQCAPFPKRGYILKPFQDKDKQIVSVEADIGRRSSLKAAQRAALRMLSRLTRWYPRIHEFGVSWQTLDARRNVVERGASYGDDPDDNPLESVDLQGEHLIYQGVTRPIIQAVARRNGVFRDLTRTCYGDSTYDALNDVTINLGTRASYEAGSRATMRTLARRLHSPFNAVYEIRWKYPRRDPRPDRRIGEITVSYSPIDEGSFIVERYIDETPSKPYPDSTDTLVSFDGMSRRALIAVGRRSGTFRDLTRFGAKGYRKEK